MTVPAPGGSLFVTDGGLETDLIFNRGFDLPDFAAFPLLRVTDDGASWAPTWSPAGDGIAFLHLDGQTVDLRLAKLEGDANACQA